MHRFLAHVLRTGPSDDASIAYRASTAACVVISVMASVTQGAVASSTGWLAVLLVPVGFLFSYQRRGKKNIGLKILLTVALFLAFAAFLQAVRGATNVDDTRAPLVAVFLWVQVMHSFDVPRARDLSFSIAASVVLIALAGSLAFSTSFIVFVLLHATLFVTSLVLAYRAELWRSPDDDSALSIDAGYGSGQPGPPKTAGRALAKRSLALAVVTLVLASVMFVFLPRLPATQLASLPFSFGRANPIDDFVGDVALPNGASETGSSEAFDPDTYFGYGEALNLRARGTLSDDLVMRVRSPRPSLYRAQGYDTYTGGRWTSSDTDLEEMTSSGLGSIGIPSPPEGGTRGTEVVQTFYVERELPNIVFHAYRPQQIFVAETRVRVDDFSSIRLPFTMDVDTIYSVISDVPDRDVDDLRFAPPIDPRAPEWQRYLQLPPSLGKRFRDLALEITAPHQFAADKAEAVQTWLKQNKRYRLDISRDPPGKDPVNVFVFERDEGFCEQIAATMALMLRAAGVPTRVVTGFGEGERNLFTGYWEIKNSDAHAWVEVFYPGHGWQPYDPTFGVPFANAANTTFMLAPLAKITSAVPAFLGDLSRLGSKLVNALPGPRWAGSLAIVVLGALGASTFIRRRSRRLQRGRDPSDRVIQAWLGIEKALAAKGMRRLPHETAAEFATRVGPVIGVDVNEIAALFGSARYGSPDARDAEAFEQTASELVSSLT
jgi:protein-glutamine gamma-glutamyltransferase